MKQCTHFVGMILVALTAIITLVIYIPIRMWLYIKLKQWYRQLEKKIIRERKYIEKQSKKESNQLLMMKSPTDKSDKVSNTS